MVGVEADGEAKRFIVGGGVEELSHGLRHDGGDGIGLRAMVGFSRGLVVILGQEFGPAVVAPPVVEFLIGLTFEGVVSDAEITDETGVVAVASEDGWVGLFPLFLGQDIEGAEPDAVQTFGHTGEVGDTTPGIDGGGRVGVAKPIQS